LETDPLRASASIDPGAPGSRAFRQTSQNNAQTSSEEGSPARAGFARAGVGEEVPLNWNKWIRQIHRWLSMAFTVAVIVNIVAIAAKKYTGGVGLLAVAPLALLLVTGLYLFVLPYAAKWRSGRRTE
jgi:hypothetical protein